MLTPSHRASVASWLKGQPTIAASTEFTVCPRALTLSRLAGAEIFTPTTLTILMRPLMLHRQRAIRQWRSTSEPAKKQRWTFVIGASQDTRSVALSMDQLRQTPAPILPSRKL